MVAMEAVPLMEDTTPEILSVVAGESEDTLSPLTNNTTAKIRLLDNKTSMMSKRPLRPLMKRTTSKVLVVDSGVSKNTLTTEDFDPKKYLDFEPPSKVYTMADLKLPEGTGVSSFAVSEPFQLFTYEAVQRMRAEIFRQEVWDNCQYSSNLAQCQLRGFAAK